MWVKRKSKMCEDCSRCALTLKVNINKIHSTNAVRTMKFREKAPLHTHTLFTESETGSNDTNIYISKTSGMINLSFPFASQFLKMQLHFELEYIPMNCLFWVQYDNSCYKVLIAVLKERIKLDSFKDPRLRCSSLSKPACSLSSLLAVKQLFSACPPSSFSLEAQKANSLSRFPSQPHAFCVIPTKSHSDPPTHRGISAT